MRFEVIIIFAACAGRGSTPGGGDSTGGADGGSDVAAAPWPMFGRDPTHQRRSPSDGTHRGTPKWTFTTGSAIQSSPSVALDGTVYAGAHDKAVYSVAPTSPQR